MGTYLQDIRYGLRVLAKSPAFTAIALLTLMLGIGATAAIFSLVDAVLLRSLPYRNPERLVMIYEDAASFGFPHNTPAPGNFSDWKKQTQIFDEVGALAEAGFNLTATGGEPEKLGGAAVTQNLFQVLGVTPALGRTFSPDEDKPGGPHVVLISHGLWLRRFGGDPKLVGRDISLNNEKYTVVGVMPAAFSFPTRESEIWTPIAFTADQLADRGSHFLDVVGRLAPGVSTSTANAELKVLAQRVIKQYPDNFIQNFFVEPLQFAYTREVRQGLVMLFGAVGFILLIGCANIANLLLSRASGRNREVAVRTALGADRLRIVRQLLTENALLSIAGGALGILLAVWSFNFLKNLIPLDLTHVISLQLNARVLAFTALISLACSLFFGLAPALQVSKVDLNDVLKEGGRGHAGGRRKLFRDVLVVSEVALSLMLLVGAGLLLKSFSNLRGLDPGFRSDGILSARIQVAARGTENYPARTQFFERLLATVQAQPGVQTAGFTSALPLTWKGGSNGFVPVGTAVRRDLEYDANNRVVSPGYFETMRIPLREGRLLNASDGASAPPVALINETMARKFWPGVNPIGRKIQPKFGDGTPDFTIVGIVGDVRQMNLNEPARQEMYYDYRQARTNWMIPRDLVIRTARDPRSVAGNIRRAVWSIDPNQPVSNIMTLDELLDQEVAQRRLQATLLGGLAALALTLACIGIYGVLSYLVSQRTQEIGLRVALGASSSDVFRAVAGQGLSLTGIGIVLGIAGSLAVSRLMANLLFGLRSTDVSTYFGAVAVFGIVALLACYVPARRAAKVDPMIALRYE